MGEVGEKEVTIKDLYEFMVAADERSKRVNAALMEQFDITRRIFDRFVTASEVEDLAAPTPAGCSMKGPDRDAIELMSASTPSTMPTTSTAIVDTSSVLEAAAPSGGTLDGEAAREVASTPATCSTDCAAQAASASNDFLSTDNTAPVTASSDTTQLVTASSGLAEPTAPVPEIEEAPEASSSPAMPTTNHAVSTELDNDDGEYGASGDNSSVNAVPFSVTPTIRLTAGAQGDSPSTKLVVPALTVPEIIGNISVINDSSTKDAPRAMEEGHMNCPTSWPPPYLDSSWCDSRIPRPIPWPSFAILPGGEHLSEPVPPLQGTSGKFPVDVAVMHYFLGSQSWVSSLHICLHYEPDREEDFTSLQHSDRDDQFSSLSVRLNVLEKYLKKPCTEPKEATVSGLISKGDASVFKLWHIPWFSFLFLELISQEPYCVVLFQWEIDWQPEGECFDSGVHYCHGNSFEDFPSAYMAWVMLLYMNYCYLTYNHHICCWYALNTWSPLVHMVYIYWLLQIMQQQQVKLFDISVFSGYNSLGHVARSGFVPIQWKIAWSFHWEHSEIAGAEFNYNLLPNIIEANFVFLFDGADGVATCEVIGFEPWSQFGTMIMLVWSSQSMALLNGAKQGSNLYKLCPTRLFTGQHVKNTKWSWDPVECMLALCSSEQEWTTLHCHEKFQWSFRIWLVAWILAGFELSTFRGQTPFQEGRDVLRADFSYKVHVSRDDYTSFVNQIPVDYEYYPNKACYFDTVCSDSSKTKGVHMPWDPSKSFLGCLLKIRLGDKPSFKKGGMLGPSCAHLCGPLPWAHNGRLGPAQSPPLVLTYKYARRVNEEGYPVGSDERRRRRLLLLPPWL